MVAELGTGEQLTASKKLVVPDYLVREMYDGVRWIYRGYRDVLNGLKEPEEVMACSTLQSVLVGYLYNKLWNHLEDRPFWVMSNEVGNNISKKSKAAYDIAVFDKEQLPPSQINVHYANVAPRLVVEVDLKVESEDKTHPDILIQQKTQKLIDFGVQKVIWVFTKTRKIFVCYAKGDWIMSDWDRELELWEGLTVNIPKYLERQGIHIDVAEQPSES
jgi:Uma2 family endonuclease